MSEQSKSLKARDIFFCKKCLVSSARPRISFDKFGVCNGCNYLEKRNKEDFSEKQKELKNICDEYRSGSGYYDCIVPWSGGKDSSYIAHRLKFEFKMNPLLVTFAPLIPTDVGYKNRENLVNLGFDHQYFRPNQKVSKLLSKRFFFERGDPKIHWNAGINSTPLRVSIEKKIPLIFYAEHGDSQYGGNPINKESSKFKDLDEIYENLIGDDPRNWIDEIITENDIFPYTVPDENLLKKNKTKAYFFGYFENWNVHKNYEYLKTKMEFLTHPDGRTPGTFTNFDSLDDHIDQVYYYMQFIKFGFGRASRDASRQLQHGLIDKKDFLSYVIKYDSEIPSKDILNFCEYIGISSAKFSEVVDKHRNEEIWKKTANGWDLKSLINQKLIDEN
jgi:N-acetyl sugar amidotransferase